MMRVIFRYWKAGIYNFYSTARGFGKKIEYYAAQVTSVAKGHY